MHHLSWRGRTPTTFSFLSLITSGGVIGAIDRNDDYDDDNVCTKGAGNERQSSTVPILRGVTGITSSAQYLAVSAKGVNQLVWGELSPACDA